SAADNALAEPRRGVAAHPRPEDHSRELVLTLDNSEMVQPLIAHYQNPEYAASGREVRFRELASVPGLAAQTDLRSLIAAKLRYSLSGMRIPLPPARAADLEWAEAIFVEWGHRA